MKNLFEIAPWKIVQNNFDPSLQEHAESIFSIGNGSFGQRANFEENYSGQSLQGSYVGGVYYPDKTRVGWWKNGYPEYFAKVLNSCNWIGINVTINGEELDLAKCKVNEFRRVLDMQTGTLSRTALLELSNGNVIELSATRFCSMADEEVAAIEYSIKAVNFSGDVYLEAYLDNGISNQDSNYDEFFWENGRSKSGENVSWVQARTRKTHFEVCTAMSVKLRVNGTSVDLALKQNQEEYRVSNSYELSLSQGDSITLCKYIGLASTINHEAAEISKQAENKAIEAGELGFQKLHESHVNAWEEIWSTADIEIDGDESAQQAIRFNIFHLYQTYTGKNPKLNIGPKGFTGEKYGGATYWDTEAYCIPFYLKTADQSVSRQLLKYRYNQLERAIENAEKLGFVNGAALYPMVTMNGEECHNEWEITFEEIHRNAAISFAVYNYERHTADQNYVEEFGYPVVQAIARFWAQRFNWSEAKKAYVMLGVTGPNEYENNVNNNWYTNYAARWCIEYALELNGRFTKTSLSDSDKNKWKHICDNVYFPVLEDSKVVLQQEGFMDKELIPASELSASERPINQHWSWDRILRSVYIKQADVLQGMYFFEHEFDPDTIKANFDFYEPFTVHESSLSPCVHAIIASSLGYGEKAYELYLRTSRLDLDDYNKEVAEGLHITSMAGTWMSVVEGFAGVRVDENGISIKPLLPEHWSSLSFKMFFKGNLLEVELTPSAIKVINTGADQVQIKIDGNEHALMSNQPIVLNSEHVN